ncbi:MAG: hemerythrin family protein [bacterium]|nr:hemerythrin family protein [bacterium]
MTACNGLNRDFKDSGITGIENIVVSKRHDACGAAGGKMRITANSKIVLLFFSLSCRINFYTKKEAIKMALIQWKEKYSVGVKEVDKQHKVLMDTLNELHEAMLAHKGREVLAGIIKRMVGYAADHFSYEEKNMQKFNFSGYTNHKKEHDAFVKKVVDFQEKHTAGKLTLQIDILRFLKEWLDKHIVGTDKGYTACFNKNGLK